MNEHAQAHGNAPIQANRVTLLLRHLQVAIQGRLGRIPRYKDIEEWTDVPEGTVKDWFQNKGRPTAEFLLQLLERVPDAQSAQIPVASLRLWSALDHPRVKCDQTIISHIKTILRQPSGLSLIQSDSDEARTFLLTALGHTYLLLTERPRHVGGIDVHEPDWFVPLPGVHYLGNAFQRAGLEETVRRIWPKVRDGKNRLVVLNGVEPVLPILQKDILALAKRGPVIVAAANPSVASAIPKRLSVPVNLITVSSQAENSKNLLITIRTT